MSVEGLPLEPCESLPWDSQFFGFSVARVRSREMDPASARQVDAWCRRVGVSCLYFLARADDASTTRAAEEAGYRLVDVRITLERELTAADQGRFETAGLRHARPDDAGVLGETARVSHRDTRFHYDANIPLAKSDALYQRWIEVSLEGYADAVLVAQDDQGATGYVSCHRNDAERCGTIGLVGVVERARGRSVGRRLVEGALGWFLSQGMRRVSVVTQGRNVAAQRLYQRCGFVTRSVELYYHKWFVVQGSDHG
jgi:dTDP-4-amino-4,6-dideoxy-D-galactose acyltransferase